MRSHLKYQTQEAISIQDDTDKQKQRQRAIVIDKEDQNSEATDRKKIIKHLKLNALTSAKVPETKRYAAVNQYSEEDEMTLMSCGMNIKDTFRGTESGFGASRSKGGGLHET